MFTPRFARLKGEAEGLLLEMSKGAQPSLRVYNVRPGVVDPHKDTDIHDFTPTHGGIQGYVESLLWPAVGALPSSMHSPTDELGRAFIKLVTGDGEPKEGKGVSGEGRTFANVALKRIAAS